MQRLVMAVAVIAVVMGAFLVGQKLWSGSSKPKTLKVGQSAEVTLRGTLVQNLPTAAAGYSLIGPDWQVLVDVAGLPPDAAAKYVGQTVRISGTQRHEVYFPKYQLKSAHPDTIDTDMLFAKSISH